MLRVILARQRLLCRFEKMALMLLHEQQKGKESNVSGYIEQLPTSFDTLLHWSPQELQLLMYPHLVQQVHLSLTVTTIGTCSCVGCCGRCNRV